MNKYQELEDIIKNSYEEGVTVEQAERYAAQFLYAQMQIANDLRELDLDMRMKKSGLKAVKAAVYLDHATKSEKKPSDSFIQAYVDSNPVVEKEQENFDAVESVLESLKMYSHIFKEAHIYFRGIAKGRFE